MTAFKGAGTTDTAADTPVERFKYDRAGMGRREVLGVI